MALEHDDAWFRQYPKKLGEETTPSLEDARIAFAAAAQSEAAHVERMLSEKVAETSVEIARRLSERPVGLHRVTTAPGAVIAFGALSVNAGYHLAGAAVPFWAKDSEGLSGAQRFFPRSSVFRQAGWTVLALLIPASVYGARVIDATGESRW
jgi:hypothetical protein